ncbi:MAG: tRNA preQ1(34) S-adenosylmethionine ribosyltransferase-isomerase QueA [Chloroflexota bacterium]|nr:tRNA preQ1(34) S-adenosylmethionine ribosyltransferase-isomerase QueA [Chloroflexota bacterium]
MPKRLIAQTPIAPRDASRLMVLDRATGAIEHHIFRDVVEYVRPGDVLVANDSRVIPARLFARKVPTGGRVELLLLRRRSERTWEALTKGRKVKEGMELELRAADSRSTPVVTGEVVELTEGGRRLIEFDRPIEPLLDELGLVPLPPYIHEPLEEPERYQTVYARVNGSVAAPTAGLHFTPDLMERVEAKGARFAFVTLHVGLDTFRPIREERVEDHVIHSEYCELSPEVAEQLKRAKAEGGRIIAVGTTSVRALETAVYSSSEGGVGRSLTPLSAQALWNKYSTGQESADSSASLAPFSGWTDLFIYPGYHFHAVDALITNFHLPRSTLLVLVSAFAGRELIMRAYREAIRQGYRFYSFGDTMLIL